MKLLDGKKLSKKLKKRIAVEVQDLESVHGRSPHLVVVLVGNNPASASYVKSKVKSCKKVGMESSLIHLDESVREEELLELIDKLNKDDLVDGFMVQLPLPEHIDKDKINLAIAPDKDVDGFHPANLGRMMLNLPSYLPATPYGILQLLDNYEIDTEGKHCVVIGRSAIVGRPISILLSSRREPGNCTVTVVHSRTENPGAIIKQGDIIIVAIGKAHYLKKEMVKEGAVVIDVGINRINDSSRAKGYRIVGDADFDGLKEHCSAITPVPGGVGPLTVTSLLLNTLDAAKHSFY